MTLIDQRKREKDAVGTEACMQQSPMHVKQYRKNTKGKQIQKGNTCQPTRVKIPYTDIGVVKCTCKPSSKESEAGGWRV